MSAAEEAAGWVAACSVVAGCCFHLRVAVEMMVMHVDLPTFTCFD
jgi:hypothetical protein